MPHPLENKLADLRRRVRRLLLIRGLCAILSAALAAAIVLGSMDYLFRFQDRGLRIILSLGLLAAALWACYRFLYLPATGRLRIVDLAARLQRTFPALDDRLLSAVEFIAQDEGDPTAGSPTLRRTVIAEATAQSDEIDFNQALDIRPVVRGAWLATIVCATAAVLVIVNPSASLTALARLLNPLGAAAWTQKNHLAVRNPVDRIGRGQPFEIEVVDSAGAPLPAEVYAHFRFAAADRALAEETALMHQVAKTAIARRENVLHPFSYRVEGGDDRSMPWQSVDVAPQPAIESLSIRLIPPAYTGWPAQKAENNIRALVGTRFEIEATATKPLQSAGLCLDGGRQFPGRLSTDGLHVAFSDPALVVQKSGSYSFRLTDRQNLEGGQDDRWEITAVADAPPTVTIEQPPANLYVAPQANVPLRIAIYDDLAIRDVALAFSTTGAAAASNGATAASKGATAGSSSSAASTPADKTNPPSAPGSSSSAPQETIISLYTGPQQVPQPPPGDSSQPPSSGERRVVEYSWNLEPLHVAPGVQVVFQAVASDYSPQAARSDQRRLFVLTPREIEERIAGRQTLLSAELERVFRIERASRGQVDAAKIRVSDQKRVEKPDLDQLRAAELGQRQAASVLTSPSDGIPSHAAAMLADLENNRIDNPDLKERLQTLLDEIDRLKRDHLPAVERELTVACKSAEIALAQASPLPDAAAEIDAALAAAEKNQDEVAATLEKLIAQLSQWQGSLRFQRDLNLLLRQQEDTARQTAETGRRTIGRDPQNIPTADAADLKIVASRQFDHARSLDRILQDMDRARADLERTEPQTAKIVAIALDQAARMGISPQMRSCADDLRQNQVGQAAELQADIIENLRQIIDILVHQSTRQSAAEQLSNLEKAVKYLRERQENIQNETRQLDEARQSEGQLTRRQSAAVLDLARLERSLQIDALHLADQLTAAAAFALALDSASRDMEQAATSLDRLVTGPQSQQAQQSAIRRLDLVLDALKPQPPANQPNQPNQPANPDNKAQPNANQPPKEQPNTVNVSELRLLKILQEDINRRTAALAEAVGPNAQPNDSQRKEYDQLAQEQARLAELILKMMEKK